ncbi:AraC family transcriptional regulator [Fulvitalea axinellae]|uniref:AraC family transcriptional regulator n=1 Tax=Fulvitalea axinellae TaxID=1182444 RepID=A0AAU9CEL0_9BACT|nr:AraC family transcriptional regulator [Fulvitalea axinellae]
MTFSEIKDKEYVKRVDTALRYIDCRLDERLTLESVATEACFSPYHFHRIFKVIIGEPLNAYILRKRIERASAELMHRPETSVGDVATRFGFGSNSSFTRAFKKHYGVSPTELRERLPGKFSKIGISESKIGQKTLILDEYIRNIENHLNWIMKNAKIEIKETPDVRIACLTHMGEEGVEKAFGEIIRWGAPKGITGRPETLMARVFHDSFRVTAPEKVRMSIGVVTDAPIGEEDSPVSAEVIGKGRKIVAGMEIPAEEFGKAWSSLFVWMTDNGFKKSEDGNPFEIYRNDPREHPEGKFLVDLCIPIE